MLFVDFEASSLAMNSWPIEIGVAWITEDLKIRAEGHLIRPEPSWEREAWSSESAAVHGIAFESLEAGVPAREVCAWFADLSAGCILASDAPEFDKRWLDGLLEAGRTTQDFRVIDFDQLVRTVFAGRGVTAVYRTLSLQPTPHRGAGDARRLAAAWRAGLRLR